MKVLSTKEIKVQSRTFELIKKPKAKNQNSGFVTVGENELRQLTVNDKLKLVVLDQEDNEIATRTMTYQELERRLAPPYFNSRYRLLRY